MSETNRELLNELDRRLPDRGRLQACIACGTCASRCPASGLEGMDPRRYVNLLAMGRYEEATRSPWVWMCSLCRRCQVACPMDIDIPGLVYLGRTQWPRSERPKGILGSCDKALATETLSAMGLPVDDWTWVVGDILEEVHEEQPEWADLEAPMDRKGATFLLNENSRAPGTEPEEMIPLWKILHRVGADWTYSSRAFAGENYCMFLADDDGWRHIDTTKFEVAKELGVEVFRVAEDLRFVLRACVGEESFVDMVPNRSNNYCCGGGGGYLQSGYNDARFRYGQRKYQQILETGAAYCVTPCHNCHQQVEELAEHFGPRYRTVHLWTIICLAMGALGPKERKYLGPDLAEVGL